MHIVVLFIAYWGAFQGLSLYFFLPSLEVPVVSPPKFRKVYKTVMGVAGKTHIV